MKFGRNHYDPDVQSLAVSVLLLALIILSWMFSARVNGMVSLSSALLLGFSVYSTPALLGYYLRPGSAGLLETAVSANAAQILVWAWLWVLVGLVLFSNFNIFRSSDKYVVLGRKITSKYDSRTGLFCLFCLAASVALYTWIALADSALYFLDERQVGNVAAEKQKLLWKWVNLYGLISAILIRSRVLIFVFCGFIAIYFLAGDRTMVLISGVAVAVYFFQDERNIRHLVRLDFLFLILIVILLILLGKPIYMSVKLQTIAPLEMLLSPRHNAVLLSFFEPLLTHTILEDVVRSGFAYSWSDLGRGVFGQLLVVPSAFGIDSSAFNVQLQQKLYAGLGYGVANHYFAQAWSLSGWSGVMIFSLTLVLMVSSLNELARRASPLPRIMLVTMGVVVGSYFFRNSLENILSMLRQILLVGVTLLLATQLCSRFRVRQQRYVTYD